MVAVPRVIHRDGIHFQGLRYLDPALAAHVGQSVTIRYDPRDITEIRVFLDGRFLCKAINPDHATETITLTDIQAARTQHRRALHAQLKQRRSLVDAPSALSAQAPIATVAQPIAEPLPHGRLKTYRED